MNGLAVLRLWWLLRGVAPGVYDRTRIPCELIQLLIAGHNGEPLWQR